MSDKDLERLIAAWLDGRLTAAESEVLQDRLETSKTARDLFREYTELDSALSDWAQDGSSVASTAPQIGKHNSTASPPSIALPPRNLILLATGAIILLAVASTFAYQLGRDANTISLRPAETPQVDSTDEQTLAGYATLRSVAGVQWGASGRRFREGDVLPSGTLQFDSGIVEIDFFCGATIIVEGPAHLELESDWSVRILKGRMRASVPPAARGFVVKAADSKIIDLGTEFALDVTADTALVAVVDGEIELQGGLHDGKRLTTGEHSWLRGETSELKPLNSISTFLDVAENRSTSEAARFNEWLAASKTMKADDRLIAYYPIASSRNGRVIPDASERGVGNFNAKLLGPVGETVGRFGEKSRGLEFDRPGSRLRTRIDGEFTAFTFACWARIDDLQHQYNAIFMGDGYENGEPHWQIDHNGRLMFSVMVDDTPGAGDGPAEDARLHKIYRTEPFWDVSKSGQWFHLVAVYDPAGGRVKHYVNGVEFADEQILDRFRVTSLKIGPAEIGNWGQPFRKSPWFAVRNLDGTIDELAIFDTALSSDEIADLYDQGKPLGY